MKTVLVLGCSWSAGHGRAEGRWYNWPAEMARALGDEVRVVNAARGGTSLTYAVHILDVYLRNFPAPDAVILQVTGEGRLTIIDGGFKDANTMSGFMLYSYSDFLNYYEDRIHGRYEQAAIDTYGDLDNVDILYPASVDKLSYVTTAGPERDKGLETLYHEYFGIVEPSAMTHTISNANIVYAKHLLKDIPHLIVSHYIDQYNGPYTSELVVDSIDLDFRDDILGQDKFSKNLVDTGYHLTPSALKEIGDYLAGELKVRNMV